MLAYITASKVISVSYYPLTFKSDGAHFKHAFSSAFLKVGDNAPLWALQA